MKKQIRFKYNGTWTQWFDLNKSLPDLRGIRIEAVHISEEMTKSRAEEYLKEFYDSSFKFP